ncbi:WD40 repeat domain-containing protein [bacterium]|nr:WD40 repeat domain-containing protein [bacterium]
MTDVEVPVAVGEVTAGTETTVDTPDLAHNVVIPPDDPDPRPAKEMAVNVSRPGRVSRRRIVRTNPTTASLRMTLDAHVKRASCVAFDSDSAILASTSLDDSEVKLWDARTGKLLAALEGHRGAIWCVCFSPVGPILASSGDDGTTNIWEVASEKAVHSLAAPAHARGLTFSPDGALLASLHSDRMVRLWQVESGQEVRVIEAYDVPASDGSSLPSVAFSPDGSVVATGSYEGSVRLSDVLTGRQRTTLDGDAGAVLSVAFSPDGETLAVGGTGAAVLFDLKTGTVIVRRGSTRIDSIAFSPDGTVLATADADRTITLWDAKTGFPRKVLDNQVHASGMAFSPDGSMLASAGEDGKVRVWGFAAR